MKKTFLFIALAMLSISYAFACSVGGTISGSKVVCPSANSGLLTLSGHTGTVVQWEYAVAPFTSWSVIVNTSPTYTSGSLSQTTRFRAIVQDGVCPSDTSDEAIIVVTAGSGGYWQGNVSSSWTDPLNWCGGVPGSSADIIISTGAVFYPVITSTVSIDELNIQAGASLTVNAGGDLTISGLVTNNGVFNPLYGTVRYTGNNIAAGTYGKLYATNGGPFGAGLRGNVIVQDSFRTNYDLSLNNYNITFGDTAGVSVAFIIMGDHPGSITYRGVDSGEVVKFRVDGNTSDMSEFWFTNKGAKDDFTFSKRGSVSSTYGPDFTPTGTTIFSNVIKIAFQFKAAVSASARGDINIYPHTFTFGSGHNYATAKLCRWNGTEWGVMPTVFTGMGMYGFKLDSIPGIFVIADDVARATHSLPVDLLSLNAFMSSNNVEVTWKTASETNNATFEVQRSLNNKDFATIETLKGAGNSNRLSTYNFTDENAAKLVKQNTVVYYRIKQTDFDGKSSISCTVPVSARGELGFELSNAPVNPVTGAARIVYTSSSEQPLSVHVVDALGKTVYQTSEVSQNGLNTLNLDVFENLGAGVYVVILSQANTSHTVKLIKQ